MRRNTILPLGKISPELLESIILPKLGKLNPNVIIPPRTGFDAGVFRINNNLFEVVATDPVLGIPEDYFGFFIFHFAASDVAVFGGLPQYLIYSLLLPPNTQKEKLNHIITQVDAECRKYGVYIITGHTGSYTDIPTILAVSTVLGFTTKDRLITPAGAKPGDKILITKEIGLEFLVMTVYSKLYKKVSHIINKEAAEDIKKQITNLSVVPEAILLSENGYVSAMHDITEGGLSTALPEVANASNLGFIIYEKELPLRPETKLIAEEFSTTPLAFSSTGSLLAAVPKNVETKVLDLLHARKIPAKVIGEFVEEPHTRIIVQENGSEIKFPEFLTDPYASLIEF